MVRLSLIVVVSIIILIAFTIGFMIGSYATIKAVAEVAKGFVDKDVIEMALNQYSEKIKTCYPLEEYALIRNSTRNQT